MKKEPTISVGPSSCDFTGEKIKVSEPYLLFTEKTEMSLSGAESFYNQLNLNSTDGICDYDSYEISQKENKSQCDLCNKKDTVITKITLREFNNNSITLCNRCREEKIQQIRSFLENFEEYVLHWEEDRFAIINPDYTKEIQKEFNSDYLVCIGGASSKKYVKLKDIDEFSRLLNTSELLERPHKKSTSICDICNEITKNYVVIENNSGRLPMCKSCRENIINSIQKYVKNNKKKLISLTI